MQTHQFTCAFSASQRSQISRENHKKRINKAICISKVKLNIYFSLQSVQSLTSEYAKGRADVVGFIFL